MKVRKGLTEKVATSQVWKDLRKKKKEINKPRRGKGIPGRGKA